MSAAEVACASLFLVREYTVNDESVKDDDDEGEAEGDCGEEPYGDSLVDGEWIL